MTNQKCFGTIYSGQTKQTVELFVNNSARLIWRKKGCMYDSMHTVTLIYITVEPNRKILRFCCFNFQQKKNIVKKVVCILYWKYMKINISISISTTSCSLTSSQLHDTGQKSPPFYLVHFSFKSSDFRIRQIKTCLPSQPDYEEVKRRNWKEMRDAPRI